MSSTKKNFSQIATPLNQLLKKNIPYIWTWDHEMVFDDLKEKLITVPVLAYPDFAREFFLFTDTSKIALGAILAQKDP
ncbi:12507_t:CDS:2, partial [Racocetra persica]